MIEAVCRTGDDAMTVKFDATEWFEVAEPEHIQDLVGSQWTDRPAARIAIWEMDGNDNLLALFRYVLLKQVNFDVNVRFSCVVNRDHALAWLRLHRPEWYRGLGLHEREHP